MVTKGQLYVTPYGITLLTRDLCLNSKAVGSAVIRTVTINLNVSKTEKRLKNNYFSAAVKEIFVILI
jgi:hypothetical protein